MRHREQLNECFRDLFTESRELCVPRTISRVSLSSLSALTFLRDYVAVNRPVIVTDAINEWAASKKWQDNDYLRQKAGNTIVSINTTPNGHGDCIINNHFVKPYEIKRPFSTFLDYLVKPFSENMLPGVAYLSHQNDSLRRQLPSLLSDVDPHILPFAIDVFGGEQDATNLWIGDDRSVSAMHKDPYENLYAVVRGEKIFTLLPPTDHPFLLEQKFPSASFKYEEEDGWAIELEPDQSMVSWIPIDIDHESGCFPKQNHPFPSLKFSVYAGEVLFLPALWYHKVQQVGITIAVNSWYDMAYDFRWVYYQFLRSVTPAASSSENL